MSQTEECFISHAHRMRDVLLRAVLAIVIIFVVPVSVGAGFVMPARPAHAGRAAKRWADDRRRMSRRRFFVPIKVTMMAAFLLALPWVFYQVWAFVAPGLYQHENVWARLW